MHALADKANARQKSARSMVARKPAAPSRVSYGPSREAHPFLHLQHLMGNQAMLRQVQARAVELTHASTQLVQREPEVKSNGARLATWTSTEKSSRRLQSQ
jgi:hypothetical protein